MALGSITGDVRIVTVNGPIRLDVRPDVNATLDATTVNGGVVVADAVLLMATERARVRVQGRINAGGPRIQVHTMNGGIRVGTGDGAAAPDGGEPLEIQQDLRSR